MSLPGRDHDESRRAPSLEAGASAAPDATPSPCINVCRMDAAGRLCAGCYRTLAEIATWSSMDDPAKREVWRQLPQRRAAAAGTLPPCIEERP